MSRQPPPPRPDPRLYLLTPQIDDAAAFATVLREAVEAADVAAVLLRQTEADERTLINRAKILAPIVQASGPAFLIEGHAQIVARAGADGAHLVGITAFDEAVSTLKPDRIAGCGGLETRHDAMLAAEHGTDYVLFGEPDADGERPSFAAVEERVAWWAEVFEAPCVGYAGSLDEVDSLVAAGADFIAVGEWVWNDERGPGAAIADIARRLTVQAR